MQNVHPCCLRHHFRDDVSVRVRREQSVLRRSSLGQVQPPTVNVSTPSAGSDRQLIPADNGDLPDLPSHMSLPRGHRPPVDALHAQVPLASSSHHPAGNRLDHGTHIRQSFHSHLSAIPSARSLHAVAGSTSGRYAFRSDDSLQHSAVLRDRTETEPPVQHRLRKRSLQSRCLSRSVSHTDRAERATYTRDYPTGKPSGKLYPPADERRRGGTQHHRCHDSRCHPLPRLSDSGLYQPPVVLHPWRRGVPLRASLFLLLPHQQPRCVVERLHQLRCLLHLQAPIQTKDLLAL